MIPFIDISSHQQGTVGIDWPAVAKYLTGLHPEAGVIVKVSEGVGYVNPFLHQQRQGAHAAGIRNVGLYHYGRPSQASGSAEADWFMKRIGDDGGVLAGEFYALDVEDTAVPATADLDAYVLDWSGRVGRPSGLSTIVYTGSWYADPHNLNRDPKLAQLGLWWASVGSSIPPTPMPWLTAGKGILLWQYNWTGSIPGIVGPVDLDWLVGGIDTLRPYQWGFQVDPLLGYTDVPIDVNVPLNSESLDDMKAVAGAMRGHCDTIGAARPGAQLGDVAKVIKAEADWLVRASWGH